jgi:hypothetical protein
VGEPEEADLAEALAEVGRKVGQALTDAFERLRPALDAMVDAARGPEVQALIARLDRGLRRRPCLCMCWRAHPEDQGICERTSAVITRSYNLDFLGDIAVPLCAPCAAAQAARDMSG